MLTVVEDVPVNRFALSWMMLSLMRFVGVSLIQAGGEYVIECLTFAMQLVIDLGRLTEIYINDDLNEGTEGMVVKFAEGAKVLK